MKEGKINYKQAVEWIAINDEPGADWAYKIPEVSQMVTVLLVADLTGKDAVEVALDVINYRRYIYLKN
jgi:hypothetical protein